MLQRSIYTTETPVNKIIVGPFYPSTRLVSFWIHMKGPECGALYVWEGPYIKMQIFGDFAKEWKQLWLKLTQSNDLVSVSPKKCIIKKNL